jgi:hypothetical protein
MTSPLPRLIGIHAPVPGSGKTTIAKFLVEEYNYHRIPFADPLKLMTRTLLQCFGYSKTYGEKLLNDPVLKEQTLPELGVTPRFVMQTLGTEWGRKTIHSKIWLLAWKNSVEELGAYGNVVVDDVRFPNELEIIQSHPSSALWWVDRPSAAVKTEVMAHSSQQTLDRSQFQETIVNDGSIKDLHMSINNIFQGVHA